ncbi:glutamine--tRNA ligase [Lacunimicrobium album]
MADDNSVSPSAHTDFIREIVAADIASGKHGGRVQTRFPPEPNGYLHLGHVKSICLNFGIAQEFHGKCNLRFDDTNPTKESQEYVDNIKKDIQWLGFQWAEEHYASDYFAQLFDWAVKLIKDGKAYVDSQTLEQIRANRGNINAPGVESPYRDRSVEENLDLFMRMKNGEFKEGEHVLRAKIDMASRNMNLRDPIMYRILHAHHHRTGDKWCLYAMYDFAHGQSDSIENVTHSICTLEFETHRPLYDWYIEQLGIFPSHQYEFAKLNFTYTVMSKRRLLELVEGKYVDGWDDPRMPTIAGVRRRGYPAEALRNLCKQVGVTRYEGTTDLVVLENAVRDVLNKQASRYMAVLKPIKVVITNYPEGQVEQLEAINNPEDESAGTRQVPFTRELYIEQDDFMEEPPKKFFRLSPGKEVRLRWAYYITCNEVIKDASGNITELRCTYDPLTKGGDSPDGRKVKATLHWVSATESFPATVRLYERMYTKEDPMDVEEGQDFKASLNPNSLVTLTDARLEPALKSLEPGTTVQFERLGYFCVDTKDSTPVSPVFNRTVTLKDSFTKEMQKG